MGPLFLEPAFIWLLPALALLFLLWRFLRRPAYVAITTLDWLLPVWSRPSPVRYLPELLLVLVVVLITLALMQPVVPFAERQVESRGLDIAIVLDLSDSMREVIEDEQQDTTPAPRELQRLTMQASGTTRLEATKAALREFISRRAGDRIGMVVFSTGAYVVSPLTLDYEYLRYYVDQVNQGSLGGEGMTAIGDGIALANSLLQRQRGSVERSQVIMVFTDGKHNIGRDPLEVLSEVNLAGVRVHLVAVDLPPEVLEEESVQGLITSVQGYGGRFFDVDTATELLTASAEIDAMTTGELTVREYVRHDPVYHWFALPAVVLLLLALGLRAVPYFADYT